MNQRKIQIIRIAPTKIKMKASIVLSVILAVGVSVSTNDEPKSFRKMFEYCLNSGDTLTCLSVKGISALNRAARSTNIKIIPGVTFER